MDNITDGYIELAGAIVRKAIADYKSALKANRKTAIIACERFFLSRDGQIMSADNGERIIKMCREEVEAEQKKKE